MYDKRIKTEFIETQNEMYRNMYLNLFNKANMYEELYNKDLCNFTYDEIVEYLRSLNSISPFSLRSKLSTLRLYTQWCCDNQLSIDNMNHYDELRMENLYDCINKFAYESKVFSEKQIYDIVDEIYNPCDKFFILALYEGIKGKDMCELSNLTLHDINTENNKITLCTGRELTVSLKLVNIMLESADTDTFVSFKGDNTYEFELEKSDYIYKNRTNVTNNSVEAQKHRWQKRIVRIKAELDIPQMTIPRLCNSGIINKTKEKAKEIGITPIEVLKNAVYFKDIAERYCLTNTPQYRLNDLYSKYLE